MRDRLISDAEFDAYSDGLGTTQKKKQIAHDLYHYINQRISKMYLIEHADIEKKEAELKLDIDTDDLEELSDDEILEDVDELLTEDNKKYSYEHSACIQK